ncbi:MAG: methyltransferase domain-containing protein [Henriciella sp.]
MRQSAATLEAFYATRLGRASTERLGQRMFDLWGANKGKSVLVVGYPAPVLPIWQGTARTCIGVVPAEIGETSLTGARGGVLARIGEERLPFNDGTFDRVVLLHAVEEADNPRRLLREVWRILAPEGRVIVAATNRFSFWSLSEANAFGHGRPWTRRQLSRFMSDSLLQVTASTTAVHMPPLDWVLITAASRSWERAGEILAPGLGGVVLVEATKRLYAKPGGGAGAVVTRAVKTSKGASRLPRKDANRSGKSARAISDFVVNVEQHTR